MLRPRDFQLTAIALTVAVAAAGCSKGHTDPNAGTTCPSFSDLSQGLPSTRGWRTNPSLADVNGDGYLDLAATNRKGEGPKVFLFDPVKGWLPSSQGIKLDMYSCGVGVQLKDLTGDGKIDLMVADHCWGLYLFRGDGRGSWERIVRLRHPTGEGYDDAAAGDLDGDGKMDLVALSAFTVGFTVYQQKEGGAFSELETNLPRTGGGYQVGMADLDADGRLDIYSSLQGIPPAARARGTPASKIWLQRPGGAWVAGAGLPEGDNFYGAAVGDINEDGLLDIALSRADYDGGVLMFLGAGGGAWKALPGRQPGEAPGRLMTGVAMADFNADGHLDLIAVERSKPSLAVWLGDGSGGFKECAEGSGLLPRNYTPGWGLAVGDINRDGFPDVVAGFGDEGSGALKAWSTRPAGR